MRTKRILVGATAAATTLLLMAWIVSVRTRGMGAAVSERPMPLGTPVTFEEMAKPMKPGAPSLPVLAPAMPEFTGIASWLNGPPLTPAALRGKVVLVDFWTYSCINCIRTLPYLVSWDAKYRDQGLAVVGVHTPEFAFEKEEANVRAAIARYGIAYPVPLDNAYGTWNAYGNRYWPAKYLFDAEGRLRYTHFGEGRYDETEQAIRTLLAEAGAAAEGPMTEIPSTVDFARIGTPETYLGYARMRGLESPEPLARDAAAAYSVAADPALNRFSFGGRWLVDPERARAEASGAEIVYRYSASSLHLVMAALDSGVRAEVTLDGGPVPPALRGADLFEEDGRTYVTVREERLYDLIDAKGDYGERLFRIRFLTPGAAAYAFTFG